MGLTYLWLTFTGQKDCSGLCFYFFWPTGELFINIYRFGFINQRGGNLAVLVTMVTSISHVYSPASSDGSEQNPKPTCSFRLRICSFYIFNWKSVISSTSAMRQRTVLKSKKIFFKFIPENNNLFCTSLGAFSRHMWLLINFDCQEWKRFHLDSLPYVESDMEEIWVLFFIFKELTAESRTTSIKQQTDNTRKM